MEVKNRVWADILIIIGMMIVVLLFCFPFGRKWNEIQKKMYIGEEGEYSVDPDSYYYIRIAKEYTENGFSSIRLFYDRSGDDLLTEGTGTAPVFISAMAAFIWYVLSSLGIQIGIFSLCMRLTSIVLACFVIPLYLFLKKRTSRMAGIFGALFVSLGLPYFRHSSFGYFDTDAFVGLFGIIIVLSFLECLLSSSRKKQVIYGIISCLATIGLYLSWTIFYIYPLIAVGISVAGLLFARIVLGKKDTFSLTSFGIPLGFMAILVLMGLFLGKTDKLSVFLVGLKLKETGGVWPNPSDYISELSRPKVLDADSFWKVFVSTKVDYMSYLGGIILFAFLIASFVICLIHFIRKTKTPEESFLFGAIGVWALGSFCMTLFGNRYLQFFIIPAGIVAAYGFFYGMDFLTKKMTSLHSKRVWYLVAASVVFLNFVLLSPSVGFFIAVAIVVFGFWGSRIVGKQIIYGSALLILLSALLLSDWFYVHTKYPHINTPYGDAMNWIAENTSPDAVVADFWDSGYYIQYYANRRTVADGATYDGIAVYWLGVMMNTDDEKLSAGVMRMMQVDGRSATEMAVDHCGSKIEGTELLRTILPMNRDDAETYLEKCEWNEEERKRMLDLSHPIDCPDIYFLTSADRFTGLIYFQVFDTWDFSGIGEPTTRYYYSTQSEEALDGDGSISFQLMNEVGDKGGTINWEVNKDKAMAYVLGDDGQKTECGRVVYEKDGQIILENCCDVADEGCELNETLAAYFYEEGGRVSAILCQNGQIDSTLMKLFLFDGENQGVFEKVYESDYPEFLSIEASELQKRIDTATMLKEYPTSRVVVWKVHFD